MNLFYFQEAGGAQALLSGDEARHCVRVMRMGVGDRISGVDGRGQLLEGQIVALGKERVEVRVEQVTPGWGEHGFSVQMAISPLHKPDRLEWFMEKAVELGVTEVHPFVSARTVKTGFRPDRFERIMVAAMKQCMRSRVPELHPLRPLHEVLQVQADLRLMGWCEADTPMGGQFQTGNPLRSVLVFIGPEGDFTPDEVKAARAAGVIPVQMGHSRLRTETAALHALSVVKHHLAY